MGTPTGTADRQVERQVPEMDRCSLWIRSPHRQRVLSGVDEYFSHRLLGSTRPTTCSLVQREQDLLLSFSPQLPHYHLLNLLVWVGAPPGGGRYEAFAKGWIKGREFRFMIDPLSDLGDAVIGFAEGTWLRYWLWDGHTERIGPRLPPPAWPTGPITSRESFRVDVECLDGWGQVR